MLTTGQLFLRGNYGFGNLGDDVLLQVMLRAVAGRFSPGDVIVECAHPEPWRQRYPAVRFLDYGVATEIHANTVVYGGGGQFFSFKDSSGLPRQLMRVRRLMREGMGVLRTPRSGRRSPFSGDNITAFCIGVGPFQGRRGELEAARASLRECSLVSVRDEESLKFCHDWNIPNVQRASDAAFLTEYWHEPDGEPAIAVVPAAVGIVFRGWTFDNYGQVHAARLRKALQILQRKGIRVIPICLSASADTDLLREFGDTEIRVWQPSRSSPWEFVRGIVRDCGVVVSTRAHGVILPATLGLGGVCVDIEPKLKNVHNMLPKSTRLWGPPFDEHQLVTMVLDLLDNFRRNRELLQDEVSHNRVLARNALAELLASCSPVPAV